MPILEWAVETPTSHVAKYYMNVSLSIDLQ